jgi:hypothetical protein
VLWVVAQEVQVKVQQTRLTLLQQRYDGRLRREGEHLRRLMPDAHRWTIEITAQILVARGLDPGGDGASRRTRPAPAACRAAVSRPSMNQP